MSTNSLSFTNVKDGIFNNLYLINEDEGLEEITRIRGEIGKIFYPYMTEVK